MGFSVEIMDHVFSVVKQLFLKIFILSFLIIFHIFVMHLQVLLNLKVIVLFYITVHITYFTL